MRYVSTRGEAPPLGFVDVTLTGLARDGGLYVPETWPQLDAATISGFASKSYAEVAVAVIRPFVGDSVPEADLARMAQDAYGAFRHPAVAPLRQIAPCTHLLELFHGPTLAFKDVAMQLLARLMDFALARRGERTTVVVATSGDTGGAAVEALRGRERADLFVLFPHGRVSDVQRLMMTTADESNIHALSIDGTFDDCQALVKGLFNNHALRDRLALSGVNSINWARIVAQVVYYFTAAVALGAPQRAVSFVVPTGNFGDIFAGYVAKRMGLPVERLVIATNENDILARTIESGRYELRDVKATSSPSMDIQISSNFERLLFEASGRDPDAVRGLMAGLAQSRAFTVPTAPLEAIRADFAAGRADEGEVAATMRMAFRETGELIDPHTAVAVAVAEKTQRDTTIPTIVLSTAHPAKFPEAVEAACGIRPALPDWLADLPGRPEKIIPLPAELAAVERTILAASRAAQGVAA